MKNRIIIKNRASKKKRASKSAEINAVEKKFFTPAELVARYERKITLKTLANWRSRGDGPKFTRTGGRILYPIQSVEEWEAKRTVESTSQYVSR